MWRCHLKSNKLLQNTPKIRRKMDRCERVCFENLLLSSKKLPWNTLGWQIWPHLCAAAFPTEFRLCRSSIESDLISIGASVCLRRLNWVLGDERRDAQGFASYPQQRCSDNNSSNQAHLLLWLVTKKHPLFDWPFGSDAKLGGPRWKLSRWVV